MACKKSTILRRMSVSLTPSQESSKQGASTNTTDIDGGVNLKFERSVTNVYFLIASECLNKLTVVHSAICSVIYPLMILSLGLIC